MAAVAVDVAEDAAFERLADAADFDATLLAWSSLEAWPAMRDAAAARDIPAGTVVWKETPVACVSLVVLPEGHPAEVMFPDNTRICRPLETSDSSSAARVWSQTAEMVGALRAAGYTDETIGEHFTLKNVPADNAGDANRMARAVYRNEIGMVCPWTGTNYGLAVCARASVSFHHSCDPTCDIVFGPRGVAFVVTRRAVPAGTPITLSRISHVHGAAMCACLRNQLIRNRTGWPCGCDSCRGDGACTVETRCSSHDARTMYTRDQDIGKALYDPLDHTSLRNDSDTHLAQMLMAWRARRLWISARPYALARFAAKLTHLTAHSKSAEEAEDRGWWNEQPTIADISWLYHCVADDVAAAAAAAARARPPTRLISTPAGMLRFLAPHDPQRCGDTLAWGAEILKRHPWIPEDHAPAFATGILVRSPWSHFLVHKLWTLRASAPLPSSPQHTAAHASLAPFRGRDLADFIHTHATAWRLLPDDTFMQQLRSGDAEARQTAISIISACNSTTGGSYTPTMSVEPVIPAPPSTLRPPPPHAHAVPSPAVAAPQTTALLDAAVPREGKPYRRVICPVL